MNYKERAKISRKRLLGEAGEFIKFSPCQAERFGGIKISIFITQLHFWSDKGRDSDGWVYKTSEEIQTETYLTRKEQYNIRKKLKDMGVLQETNKKPDGFNAPTMHFKIDFDMFDKISSGGHLECAKGQIPMCQRSNSECAKGQKPLSTVDNNTVDNAVLDQFEKFWKAYPRKVGKLQATKTWNKIKPDQNLFDDIIRGVEAYKKTKQWIDEMKTTDKRHIPHPSTFLNDQRYYDEIVPNKEIQQRPVRTVPPERPMTEKQREKNKDLRSNINDFTMSMKM